MAHRCMCMARVCGYGSYSHSTGITAEFWTSLTTIAWVAFSRAEACDEESRNSCIQFDER